MKFLLDVNALVALGFAHHEFHDRVGDWLRREKSPTLMTCSITELGFIRVLAQAPAYGSSVAQARALLSRLRQAPMFEFIPDSHDASHLPGWAKAPKQLTDGHLLKLAQASGGTLATLDSKIPGAYVIGEG